MFVKPYKDIALAGSFCYDTSNKNKERFSINFSAEENYFCIKDEDRFLIPLNGVAWSLTQEDFVELFYVCDRTIELISNEEYIVQTPSILFAENERVVPVYNGDKTFPYFCAKDDYVGDNISMYAGKILERIPIDQLIKSKELVEKENNVAVEKKLTTIEAFKECTIEDLVNIIISKIREDNPVYTLSIDEKRKIEEKEECDLLTVLEDIKNNEHQKIYFRPLKDFSTKSNNIFSVKYEYIGTVIKDKVYMKNNYSYYLFSKEEMRCCFDPVKPLKLYAGQRYIVGEDGVFCYGEAVECLKTGYTAPCRSLDFQDKVEFCHDYKLIPFYESIFCEQAKEELQKEIQKGIIIPITEKNFNKLLHRRKVLRRALFSPIVRLHIHSTNPSSFFDTEKAYGGLITKDMVFMNVNGMFFCFDKRIFLKLFYPSGVEVLKKGERYFSKINGHFISKGDVVEPVSSGYHVPCKMIERNDRITFFNAEDLVPFYSVVFSERELK